MDQCHPPVKDKALKQHAIPKFAVILLLTGSFLCSQLTAQPTFTVITTGDVVRPGSNSSSSAWGDYDNDGDQDLFVANGGYGTGADQAASNFLYRNNGDGTFTQVTTGVVANDMGDSVHASWADYDRDGDLDLYVAASSFNENNALYANNGDGTFSKITSSAIVEAQVESFGSSWGDMDNDGDLDLFLANRGGVKNHLYRNNGDGTFIQVTSGDIVNETFSGRSMCGSWVDIDNDGDLDLFVANQDFEANDYLYTNMGNGAFSKITTGDVVNNGANSTGASWGDYDNDGDLDLYVTNKGRTGGAPNFLYANNGDGTFTRITEGVIVIDGNLSHSSSWGDYDNDGDIDLFVADYSFTGTSMNVLYINNSDGTFGRNQIDSGEVSSSCANADYDNDGDLDIFVTHNLFITVAPNNVLLRNDGNSNHWININCVGLFSPTPEIGTRVRIKAIINGDPVWQLREISSQTGGRGQNSLRVHFGLGDATQIDSMIINWPGGSRDIYTNVGADTFYTAIQSASLRPVVTSVKAPESGVSVTFELSQNYPNPFNPSTTIRYELPAAISVSLTIYDLLGNEVVTLVNAEAKNAGPHSIRWDGRNATGEKVASGIYFNQLRMGSQTLVQTRKMVLIE